MTHRDRDRVVVLKKLIYAEAAAEELKIRRTTMDRSAVPEAGPPGYLARLRKM